MQLPRLVSLAVVLATAVVEGKIWSMSVPSTIKANTAFDVQLITLIDYPNEYTAVWGIYPYNATAGTPGAFGELGFVFHYGALSLAGTYNDSIKGLVIDPANFNFQGYTTFTLQAMIIGTAGAYAESTAEAFKLGPITLGSKVSTTNVTATFGDDTTFKRWSLS